MNRIKSILGRNELFEYKERGELFTKTSYRIEGVLKKYIGKGRRYRATMSIESAWRDIDSQLGKGYL